MKIVLREWLLRCRLCKKRYTGWRRMPLNLPVPGTSKCPRCGKSKYRDLSNFWKISKERTIDNYLVVWEDMPE